MYFFTGRLVKHLSNNDPGDKVFRQRLIFSGVFPKGITKAPKQMPPHIVLKNRGRNLMNYILVNLAECQLSYFEENRLVKEYPVGIGKAATPTPTGTYSILEKLYDSPLEADTRCFRLANTKICIRGTHDTASIGLGASGG